MREIEQRLRAYGAACAAEGCASAAVERVERRAVVRVDGALDRFIGVQEAGRAASWRCAGWPGRNGGSGACREWRRR